MGRIDTGLTDALKSALAQYVRDLGELPNETAKRQRFASLVGTLFPGSDAALAIASGAETKVPIAIGPKGKTGSIDTYVSNAVIEFENSLKKTGAHAKEQLQEYVSGVWSKEGESRALVAIATDGLVWELYRPVNIGPAGKTIRPHHVELQQLRTLTVEAEGTKLAEFWQWLTGLLFTEGTRVASASNLRFDFGIGSPAFANARDRLEQVWDSVKEEPEFNLKRTTWGRYLAVTYGTLTSRSAELDALFIKHTYLAVVARFLVWSALGKGTAIKNADKAVRGILTGEFFRNHKIDNLVEDDFFAWIAEKSVADQLLPVWQKLLVQLLAYDLSEGIQQDLLKGLYQELVDPKDRHDLGEFYTPDWLCEAIVEELVTSPQTDRILDPTCGSGSFLRAAITKLLQGQEESPETLHAVLDRVAGIDIHPLAVTVSKATFALALGPLLSQAKRPVRLPVYLADSLFLPVEVEQLELGAGRTVGVRFGTETVHIPDELIQSPETFDASVTACQTVALDHAKVKKETSKSLSAYLQKQVPGLSRLKDAALVEEALWKFTQALAELIRKRKDSIWAFVVRNAYRPAMLKGQFNVIAGNPPWLSYRYISDPEYQDEVRRRGMTEYGLFPKQKKLVTQFELASLFLVHCLTTFGRPRDSRLGFVMPHSVWSADQHWKLREGKYNAPVTITNLWELKDVFPLFNVPSGVVFARHEIPDPLKHKTLALKTFSGRLLDHNANWSEAKLELSVGDGTARRIYLGERSAWSDGPGSPVPTAASPYLARFRQGASLVPRNCFFVVGDVEWPPESDALYHVSTDELQAKSSKPPYTDIRMAGEVEGAFVFRTALSKHVLPFVVLDPPLVVLPIEQQSDGYRVLTPEALTQQGNRRMAQWMRTAGGHWAAAKGKKDSMSLEASLDFQNKLSSQSATSRWLVLYNAAGMHVAAAMFDNDTVDGRFIVDAKLYWTAVETQEEAHYLCAILNSEVVNLAVKPFQSLGLLGERDIHKKPLELAIPSYRSSDTRHRRLASLGKEAATKARKLIATVGTKGTVGADRGVIREALKSEMAEINAIVEVLLAGAD